MNTNHRILGNAVVSMQVATFHRSPPAMVGSKRCTAAVKFAGAEGRGSAEPAFTAIHRRNSNRHAR